MIHRIWYSFSKLCSRVKHYIFIVFLAGSILSGKITPTFGSSTFDTLRLGDQITSDMLEEIRAFQAILAQPIALGLLVRGGVGHSSPPGASGDTGGKETRGDGSPVGEKGSDGFQGTFGKTGAPGHPRQPGTPGYEIISDSNAKYANEERNDRGDFANNLEADDQRVVQWKYTSEQVASEKTKIFCEGEASWLGCEHDERINITNAFWGRDDFVTCSQSVPSKHSTRQYSLDYDRVLMKVKETCNRRSSCEFYATRLFLNDATDPQVYKYLRVVYECVPETYDKDNFGAHRERRISTNETPR